MDPFCKYIFKRLSVAKHPDMKLTHLPTLRISFTSVVWFIALGIPKSWHFTVLLEAHDKLGHQGVNRTYHLIRHRYYWKGMNKDIHKYINNCALCKREKVRTWVYPLQMTDIPDKTLWQNSHRSGLRCQHLFIRESTYTNYHWSFNGMVRSFPHPWQESRYHCLCFHQ